MELARLTSFLITIDWPCGTVELPPAARTEARGWANAAKPMRVPEGLQGQGLVSICMVVDL